MNTMKQQYLKALGLEAWRPRALSQTSPLAIDLTGLIQGPAACILCSSKNAPTLSVLTLQHFTVVGEGLSGRTRHLLKAMIAAMGLGLQSYQPPPAEEVNLCTPCLHKQMTPAHPKLLLALGETAGNRLLESDMSLAQLRGGTLSFSVLKIPVVVTFHPGYLLEKRLAKSAAYTDLQKAAAIYLNSRC
jgi:uracil-DNA glycosylase family 4